MSETTANTTQTSEPTLQQALDKTDFGHWLYDHRKSFIGAVIVAFVGASSFLLYKQYSHKQAQNNSAAVYEFETAVASQVRDGKVTPAEFNTKFQALPEGVKASAAMLPVALQTAAYLTEKGEAAMAESTLKSVVDAIGAKSALYPLVAHSYVAVLEKNGKQAEAITILEGYIAQNHVVMIAKAYLDLGRLYLAKGDSAKAKTNLDYVVSKYPNDEAAKMARMYLQQVQGQ